MTNTSCTIRTRKFMTNPLLQRRQFVRHQTIMKSGDARELDVRTRYAIGGPRVRCDV